MHESKPCNVCNYCETHLATCCELNAEVAYVCVQLSRCSSIFRNAMANVCTVLQSEATATKYNLFDNNSSLEVVQSRTRQRKPQYIRDNNFVVPDGSVL